MTNSYVTIYFQLTIQPYTENVSNLIEKPNLVENQNIGLNGVIQCGSGLGEGFENCNQVTYQMLGVTWEKILSF